MYYNTVKDFLSVMDLQCTPTRHLDTVLTLETVDCQREVSTQIMPIYVPNSYIELSARDLQCTLMRHRDTVLAIN